MNSNQYILLEKLIMDDAKTVMEDVNFDDLGGKNILITGASGLLGVCFLACLKEIKSILPKVDLMKEIEKGFANYSKGNVVVPPVGELHFDSPPGDVHIKYGYIKNDDVYVFKIASGFTHNTDFGIPSGNGMMLVFNQKTGQPEVILNDQCYLTDVRTAVAGAISAKYLAPNKIENIGIEGTGVQARMQLKYLKDVVDCKSAIVWGRSEASLLNYHSDMAESSFNITTTTDMNDIVVNYGHSLLKKEDEVLRVKADSFPVGANVHFPTDMNLLWDSARKCIDICEWFRDNEHIVGWRKSLSWKRDIKRIFRASSKASSSGGKNKEIRLHNIVSDYLQLCERLEAKVNLLLSQLDNYTTILAAARRLELDYFHQMLNKHIDLVNRRILEGEVISSSEKLYSIFETHAEWLSKGKKFKPVEIGHNVLIATDQFNFIIHHQVCIKQTDVDLTQEMTSTLVSRFPALIYSLSLDKGFFSKENKAYVQKLIPKVIMPKKGKRNNEETEQEHEAEFIKLRNAHSAVESNINQLQHNGLGRCPDKGLKNFKRYTSLSVLAYNLHKLGEYISAGKGLKKSA